MQQHKQQYVGWGEVKKALEDEGSRKNFRKSITPLVEEVTEDYLDQADTTKEKLMKVGFSSFDKALENYYTRMKRRKRAGESTYPFSEYFQWWIRRDIEEHLGIKDKITWREVCMAKTRNFFRRLKTHLLLLFKD